MIDQHFRDSPHQPIPNKHSSLKWGHGWEEQLVRSKDSFRSNFLSRLEISQESTLSNPSNIKYFLYMINIEKKKNIKDVRNSNFHADWIADI